MKCTYCGELAECYDHVIPVSWNRSSRRRGKVYGDRRKVTVPSCTMCNSLLGDLALHTVGRRAAYLAGRYRKRYRHALAFPEWSEEDKEELGYNLQTMVGGGQSVKHGVMDMVDHCKYVAAISPTIPEVWAEVDKEEGDAKATTVGYDKVC